MGSLAAASQLASAPARRPSSLRCRRSCTRDRRRLLLRLCSSRRVPRRVPHRRPRRVPRLHPRLLPRRVPRRVPRLLPRRRVPPRLRPWAVPHFASAVRPLHLSLLSSQLAQSALPLVSKQQPLREQWGLISPIWGRGEAAARHSGSSLRLPREAAVSPLLGEAGISPTKV